MIHHGIILKKGLPSLKTNTSPENNPSQKEIHLPTIHFQVQAVSFREGNPFLREGKHPFEIVPFQVLLLMEEILHQLRLVVYPIIYDGFYKSQLVMAGFLNHQQYTMDGMVWDTVQGGPPTCYNWSYNSYK